MKLAEVFNTSPAWYIVNRLGCNMTGHTSKPSFKSREDAEAYQKKFSHAPGFKATRIQYGKSDEHGFITALDEPK